MQLWVAEPPVADGELLLWERGASRPQRHRLIGGRLFLTERRLIFQPNRLETAAGAQPWHVALTDIVGVNPEQWMRRRLRIDIAGGTCERFFVQRLDHTGQQLVALVNRLR